MKMLLGKNDRFRQNYINSWRKKTTRAIIRAMKAVEMAEKMAFGDRSFFYCRDNNIEASSADDLSSPKKIKNDEIYTRNVARATSEAPEPTDHY